MVAVSGWSGSGSESRLCGVTWLSEAAGEGKPSVVVQAHDALVLAKSEKELDRMTGRFGNVCKNRRLKLTDE